MARVPENTVISGVVTFLRCSKCNKESKEFDTSNKARHYLFSARWYKLGRMVLCPECSRSAGLHRVHEGRDHDQCIRSDILD